MNVQDLLNQKNIMSHQKGGDYIIRCLNPEHEDKNPSLRIDQVTGVYQCFSCGFKGNIFQFFDIQRDRISEEIYRQRKLIQKMRTDQKGIPMPDEVVPFLRPYRNIQKQTYKHFGAFTQEQEYESRVVFPLRNMSGRIYAFIGRHMYSDAQKDKYMVYPPGANLQPFPSKIEPIQGSMIIVEGIFDMLNLYDKGFTNVVCIFGVSTLKDDNVRDLLRNYKLQGVKVIQLLLDSDNAGKNHAKRIKEVIRHHTDFIVEVLDVLEEGTDPGDITADDAKSLRQWIYKEGNI
jgi:DNA primase